MLVDSFVRLTENLKLYNYMKHFSYKNVLVNSSKFDFRKLL